MTNVRELMTNVKEVCCPMCKRKHVPNNIIFTPARGCARPLLTLEYTLRAAEFCENCIAKMVEKGVGYFYD